MIEMVSHDEKQTPLHYAAKYGSTAVAEYFIIDLNANKEAKDHKNRTALFIASEFSM